MNRYLEKIATKLVLYEDPATKQRKWIAGNNPVPKNFKPVASSYVRKGQKKKKNPPNTFVRQRLR